MKQIAQSIQVILILALSLTPHTYAHRYIQILFAWMKRAGQKSDDKVMSKVHLHHLKLFNIIYEAFLPYVTRSGDLVVKQTGHLFPKS